MATKVDYALLAARILRPKRNDPWPAKKAIRGITDPGEAWAVLAKTLPPAIASSASRRYERKPFVLPAPGEPGAAPAPGVDVVETPPTIGACLAIALDPDGIAFAEERAREAVRRLAPWGVAAREKTIWSIVPEWPGAGQGGEYLYQAPVMALSSAKADKKTTISLGAAFRQGADPVMGEITSRTQSLVVHKLCEPYVEASGYAAQWRRASETGVIVPPYEHAPGKIVPCAGKPFSELPDPYEPLLELMLRGYWLSGATDDALVLVAVEAVGNQ